MDTSITGDHKNILVCGVEWTVVGTGGECQKKKKQKKKRKKRRGTKMGRDGFGGKDKKIHKQCLKGETYRRK